MRAIGIDTVITIRRPADYEPSQGARFELHYEKARGLLGEAVDPIEARLEGSILDGNLWGLTFSGLDLHEGARHTLPFWHYDKGFDQFTVAVVGGNGRPRRPPAELVSRLAAVKVPPSSDPTA